MDKIKLTEEEIVDKIKEMVDEADADTLALIAANLFGGECFAEEDGVYEFTPGEDYCGTFDK
jgi:fructosamine-3-kinase